MFSFPIWSCCFLYFIHMFKRIFIIAGEESGKDLFGVATL